MPADRDSPEIVEIALKMQAGSVLAREVLRLREEAADALARQVRLKEMTVKDGATELGLESPREMVISWVWAAREMLGDAPNYSETRVDFPTAAASMEVKAAGEFERYVLTVQRAGKVTPHEARQAAEAERDQLRAQRDADLVDLRAAAQDLHDLGEACAGPIRREADAYELAAARVERVIARITYRAGEPPDAD